MRGIAQRGSRIAFGQYGLQALSNGWVASKQIEAARKALTHFTKKGGRVWIRIFPDKPISKKPPEVRMGGGKGDTHEFVSVVKAGRIMFEMAGISPETARDAMKRASAKLSVASRFVVKGEL